MAFWVWSVSYVGGHPTIILIGLLSFILLGLALMSEHRVLFIFGWIHWTALQKQPQTILPDLDSRDVYVCVSFSAVPCARGFMETQSVCTSHFPYCSHMVWHCVHVPRSSEMSINVPSQGQGPNTLENPRQTLCGFHVSIPLTMLTLRNSLYSFIGLLIWVLNCAVRRHRHCLAQHLSLPPRSAEYTAYLMNKWAGTNI